MKSQLAFLLTALGWDHNHHNHDGSFTGTQTQWATSGCDLPCNTSIFCIWDAALTQSCGCSSVPVVTTTVTLCPTSTPCQQCTTGWGIFTYTQSCEATATP
ncbi:hypothetical protein QR685DRAFT_568989 [Neurospora intermedia]|uniref:Extracellular membrane protein CFEM domain-containing protein n=1 Tax=Neurospora intermedia TaxID=5142 RepID=A0ABR3DJG6_NEUIN